WCASPARTARESPPGVVPIVRSVRRRATPALHDSPAGRAGRSIRTVAPPQRTATSAGSSALDMAAPSRGDTTTFRKRPVEGERRLDLLHRQIEVVRDGLRAVHLN